MRLKDFYPVHHQSHSLVSWYLTASWTRSDPHTIYNRVNPGIFGLLLPASRIKSFKVIYTSFSEEKGGSPVYFVSVDEVSSAMDTDTPTAHESEYGSSPWVDIGAFESPPSHHSPPLPDFHAFSYASSSIMPMEPAYNISVPPPYSTINFTMPPPNAWPSMISPHSIFPDPTLSPASTPAPSVSMPHPVPIRPLHATPASHAPTPRRTLADDDRRRMCLYHEENKSAKQTDIGGG